MVPKLRRIRLFFYNQMDDFSAKPGVPNLYGLPEQKPIVLHQKKECWVLWQLPVEKDKNFMVRTPGGSTIITSNDAKMECVWIHEYDKRLLMLPFSPSMATSFSTFEPNSFDKRTIEKSKKRKKGYKINVQQQGNCGK
jgi:gamma-glutamyltranspeptidase/glutathione hydrolase